MRDESKFIGGVLVGAGLMFLLDPDRGARRRSLVRNQAVRAQHKLGDGLGATARDLGNRARGTVAGLRSRFRREYVDDPVLHERVRSVLGRAVSHPAAIGVSISEGQVTLRGDVLEDELEPLLDMVNGVPGIFEVRNHLVTHREAADLPSLQGGRRRESRAELAQENWAPGARAAAGTIGGLLVYSGFRLRGPAGPLVAAVGLAALLRSVTNLPARRLTGIGAGRRAVDVQKVINVAAPIDQVWELWTNYENFPRFMAHLRDVRRTGDGRSHWAAVGPAGARLEWDAITTAWVPNEVIAWKSVEGAAVENAGIVRFRPTSDGGTQIDVRLSYNPPGGALGHAVAALFGADPKRAMDEDMGRLKSLLEEGKTSTDEGRVELEELTGVGRGA